MKFFEALMVVSCALMLCSASTQGFALLFPAVPSQSPARDRSSPRFIVDVDTATPGVVLGRHHPIGRLPPSLHSTKNDDDGGGDESDANESKSLRRRVLTTAWKSPARSLAFSALMVASGAALGPFLDSFHSAFGVLRYEDPIVATLWGTDAQHPALITAWWVPQLFGLAGFLIGWLYILLDAYHYLHTADPVERRRRRQQVSPSPPKILIGISIFTFQYWLSGFMYQSGVDRTTILNVMSVTAAAGFMALDNTFAGFLTSAATAVGGPLIEVGLLTLSKNHDLPALFHGSIAGYHYTDLGETGFFPLWIVPVYFLGGPANGNLARGYWAALSRALKVEDDGDVAGPETGPKEPPGCQVCSDTRGVPCPNCDGVGTYTATGGRCVKCSSCRGRGFVICRACFAHYDEDPNDIEAIRELMSRMPD